MDMPPGYICMRTSDVIRRCNMVLDRIYKSREKSDEKMVSEYMQDTFWNRLFPFLKPSSREYVIKELSKDILYSFPSQQSGKTFGDAECLLDAANATHSNTMWVAAGSFILNPVFSEEEIE